MAEELTYKRLRDLAREEKAQPSLVAISEEFFPSVESFLSSKFSEMESSRSVLQMREFENAVALIREISTIRQQKILFKAIRSGGAHGKTEEMTRQEHELYDRFCAIIEDARQDLDGVLARYKSKPVHEHKDLQPPAAPGEEAVQGGSLKKVRFIKEVPAYKGPNNETFGPYAPGQESELPPSEADWLLKGKLAEEAI